LEITAAPGTNVAVNGRVAGDAPLGSELWLEPGDFAVEGRFTDGRVAAVQVSLVAGDEKQVALAAPPPTPQSAPLAPTTAPSKPAPLTPTSSTSARKPILIGGAVFTAIAAGAGVIFALKSQRDSDSADEQTAKINHEVTQAGHEEFVSSGRACNPPYGQPATGCASLASSVESARQARTSAQVAFVSAGLIGLGTAAVFLLWPASTAPEKQSLQIAPWRDTGSTGLIARGQF
jgi:hypothetical protein